MKKSKDKNDDDIKWALKYARELMSMDWRVRSDCALDGEFYGWYGLTPEEAKKAKQDFVSALDFFENQVLYEGKDDKSTHDLGHSSIMDVAVKIAGAQDKAIAKKLMKYADLAGDGLDKYIKIIDIIGNTRCLHNKLAVEASIEVDVTETETNNEYVRISDDDFTKLLNQYKKKYKLGE